MRQSESVRATDAGLFAPQLIPFRPRSIEKLGRKLIRAKEPPWISTDGEAPHRQNESTWEKGAGAAKTIWLPAEAALFSGGNRLARDEGFRPD